MPKEKTKKIDLSKQIALTKRIFAELENNLSKYIILTLINLFGFFALEYAVSYLNGLMFKSLVDLDGPNFYKYFVIFALGVIIIWTIIFAAIIALVKVQERTSMKIKKKLFSKVIDLPVSYYESTHTGELMARLTNDVKSTKYIFELVGENLFTRIVLSLAYIVIVGVLSWPILVISLGLGIILFLSQIGYAKHVLKYSQKVQESKGRATRLFSDILAGFTVIRMFRLQRYTDQESHNIFDDVRVNEMKRINKYTLRNLVSTTLVRLASSSLIVIALFFMRDGDIDIVNMMVVIALGEQLIFSIGWIGDTFINMQQTFASAERVYEIIDLPSEKIVKHETDNDNIADENIALSIQDLKFGYSDESVIFDGFNVELEKGKTLAIVGASGGGKSTLFKLLLGFYQPTGGEINILGKRYQDMDMNQLRANMTYVPQDNYLFNSTIRENISFGKSDATLEDIVNVAKMANADVFINECENGYDTIVGERGALLSGGQRQRLAIARALLQDAPILLLDEATASLDTESEKEVQKAIETLMENRTVIVVAHRLATVKNAEKIIVLEDGIIKERGNHEELLAKNERYAYYYNMQFKVKKSDGEVS